MTRRLALILAAAALTVPSTAQAWPTLPSPFGWTGPEPRVMPIDVLLPPAISKGDTWPHGPFGGASIGFTWWPHNQPYRIVFWYDRVARTVLLSCQGRAHASFLVRAGRALVVVTRPHPDALRARVRCVFDGQRRVVLRGVHAAWDVEVAGRVVAEAR